MNKNGITLSISNLKWINLYISSCINHLVFKIKMTEDGIYLMISLLREGQCGYQKTDPMEENRRKQRD